MRASFRSIFLMLAVFCIGASVATSAPFEPAFKLENILGDVSIKLPGSDEFVPAENGKAYPYGTEVQTASGASAQVVYSANNTCAVGPEALLTVNVTSIMLDAGKVEVSLEEGQKLSVITPSSSAEATGGAFTVDVKPQAELMISVYNCTSGELAILSDMFSCPNLSPDDIVSVSAALDNSFVRIKSVKGDFKLSFTDETGTPRTVDMEQDSVIKIWRRGSDSSDAVAVTILVVEPNGTIKETINYTIRPPMDQGVADDDDDDDDDGDDQPVLGDDDDDDDDFDPILGDDDDDDDDDDDNRFPMPDDITPKGLR